MAKRYVPALNGSTFMGMWGDGWGPSTSEYVLASSYDRANEYALNIVNWLAARYPTVPGWEPLPDLLGKLTQIDNMICKLPAGFGHQSKTETKP